MKPPEAAPGTAGGRTRAIAPRPGPRERLDVARTLARDDQAGLLDTINKKAGQTTLDVAVHEDHPYFVWLRDDVLAFDFDFDGATAVAEQLHLDLLLAGYLPVLCDSGGSTDAGPRCHIIVTIENPEARARWAVEGKNRGADVRLTLRPPYTLHRRGTSWSAPVFPVGGGRRVLDRLTASGIPRPLPADLRRLILEEVTERGQRSDVILKVARALASRGWTRDEVLALLNRSDLAIGHTYASRLADNNHTGESWFTDHVWPSAADHRPDVTRRRVRQLRAAFRERVAPGRTATTDLKVLEAILAQAERAATLEPGVSRRRINELTQLGAPKTVVESLDRLKQAGLIRRVPRRELTRGGKGSRAASRLVREAQVFRLVEPEDLSDDAVEAEMPRWLQHPTFRNVRGLGANAGRIYDYIAGSGVSRTVDDIVATVGLTHRTVRAHLERLRTDGLIEQQDRGWRRTLLTPEDVLPEPARKAQEDMKVRHRVERELYDKVTQARCAK